MGLEDYTVKQLEKELERRNNPSYGKTRWNPTEDEVYWYIDDAGDVKTETFSGPWDAKRYDYGNIFATPEKADFEADKRHALIRMHDWADKWGYNEGPYYIVRGSNGIEVYLSSCDFCSFLPTFIDSDIAHRFIDTFREDLLRYFFNEDPDDEMREATQEEIDFFYDLRHSKKHGRHLKKFEEDD